jgi:hypothetical protein
MCLFVLFLRDILRGRGLAFIKMWVIWWAWFGVHKDVRFLIMIFMGTFLGIFSEK